ncbi:MAG TPA: bifunctional UDP-N-acetylglucosamine diphosphorylase/glucosamine-1-phosphate N-acetyltransferase GlmU [Pseudogracilibacillus sp.]|nr:bifunctional UDP-N-acetylglucosamine diphosphorylase/glucosamine-1-phosphate N-acetyltransferase GlmU [Pseudogracilibacillus sp.]
MSKRFSVILAAGQGTRMKSKLYKVLHPILEQPMLKYVLNALSAVSIDQTVTVVGHGAEKVKETIGSESDVVLQEEQLGTAHAVMQAESLLGDKQGTTLVVCGDTPLIKEETFEQLFAYHEETGAKATILTTEIAQPTGYGRIIRDEAGNVERIVEEKDATEAERQVNEINTGTYCFDNALLFDVLKQVDNDNAQGEYYLPDVIEILQKQGEKVSAYVTEDEEETIGINDRVALAEAEQIMKKRINEKHLLNGVTIIDPNHTYIGPQVTIEQDAVIYPGSVIAGKTHIGADSIIGPHSEIKDSTIGNDSSVRQSTINSSKIGDNVAVGPYAHIRPESDIGNEVRIGNFVEIKKSKVDDEAKISHLSYIGDAKLGKRVNVGCGTITVNYDGKNKHETNIGEDTFIGCNSNLVAPITIESGAYVAAGSTITKDVPNDALAIGRVKQENKENYVKRLLDRK